MNSLTDLLAQGTAHAWLFVPTAILLGALHGLEPGHSKTMMAAFIIAVRGTVAQAILLGLAATVSHTAVVWVVALGGQLIGRQWDAASEPYLQLVSAALILGVAGWMLWQTSRQHHDDHHHGEAKRITTREGVLMLEVFEDGVPPRWRLRAKRGALPEADAVTLETLRPDGARQPFRFVRRGEMLESLEEIPEPHAFTARLRLDTAPGVEVTEVAFEEHGGMDLGEEDDAHARAHAADIRRRFDGRHVTTGQIVLFGLTGGLIPCPAAMTVLLLCIQLKQLSLGFVLVVCFGIGLALTMVSAGIVAALSVRHIASRWSGFGIFARRAPYASSALIVLVGLYTGWLGWEGLHHDAATRAANAGEALDVPCRSGARGQARKPQMLKDRRRTRPAVSMGPGSASQPRNDRLDGQTCQLNSSAGFLQIPMPRALRDASEAAILRSRPPVGECVDLRRKGEILGRDPAG